MAPSILASPSASHAPLKLVTTEQPTLDRDLFPDGLKTSGQHPILLDQVYPYDDFPTEITGPTVWRPEEYQHSPDRWTHPFSPGEIEELGRAADDFIESGTPLTGIARVSAQSCRAGS